MTFSGGVSEYVYGWETESFGDLGNLLAAEIRTRVRVWGAAGAGPTGHPRHRDRRLAIHHPGERQHHLRVAARDAAVAQRAGDRADLPLEDETVDAAAVAAAIGKALRHLDLGEADTPVAIFVPWQGSATFHRLDAFCRGVAAGLSDVLARGHPIVLAGDGDVGGLIGIHFREEMKLKNPVVSIDGLELKQFDYIDIGEMLESSGAVPVVIKSLIFPASAALGQEWMAERTVATAAADAT